MKKTKAMEIYLECSLIFLKSKMPSYVTFPVAGRPDLVDIDIDRNGVIDLNGVDLRLLHSHIDNHEIYKQVEVSADFKLSGNKSPNAKSKDSVQSVGAPSRSDSRYKMSMVSLAIPS